MPNSGAVTPMPQGDLLDLSEEELEILVAEFQRDRGTEADHLIQRRRGPCSIRTWAGSAN
jgi:hypothetical protein